MKQLSEISLLVIFASSCMEGAAAEGPCVGEHCDESVDLLANSNFKGVVHRALMNAWREERRSLGMRVLKRDFPHTLDRKTSMDSLQESELVRTLMEELTEGKIVQRATKDALLPEHIVTYPNGVLAETGLQRTPTEPVAESALGRTLLNYWNEEKVLKATLGSEGTIKESFVKEQTERKDDFSASLPASSLLFGGNVEASGDASGHHTLARQLEGESSLGSQLFGFLLLCVLLMVGYYWAKKTKFFSRYREMFPSLAKLLRTTGIDKYDQFDLHIVVSEVTYSEKFDSYVAIDASFNTVMTHQSQRGASARKEGSSSAVFNDALSLVVPQGTEKLKFRLLDKTSNVIADGTLSLDDLFNRTSEEGGAVVHLQRKGKGKKLMTEDPKAIINIYYKQAEVEGADDDNEEHEQQDLLVDLDRDVISLGLMLELEKRSNLIKKKNEALQSGAVEQETMWMHQLEVIAAVCGGDLQVSKGFWSSKTQCRFQVYQDAESEDEDEDEDAFVGGWKLGWWSNVEKKSASEITHVDPTGSVLILNILKIEPDPNKPKEFSMTYVDANDQVGAQKTMTLKTHDAHQDREFWVECLSVFINHLRKIRHDLKHKDDHHKKKSSKHKSKRSSEKDEDDEEEEDEEDGHKKSSSHKSTRHKSKRSEKKEEPADDEEDDHHKKKSSKHKSKHRSASSHHAHHSSSDDNIV